MMTPEPLDTLVVLPCSKKKKPEEMLDLTVHCFGVIALFQIGVLYFVNYDTASCITFIVPIVHRHDTECSQTGTEQGDQKDDNDTLNVYFHFFLTSVTTIVFECELKLNFTISLKKRYNQCV